MHSRKHHVTPGGDEYLNSGRFHYGVEAYTLATRPATQSTEKEIAESAAKENGGQSTHRINRAKRRGPAKHVDKYADKRDRNRDRG